MCWSFVVGCSLLAVRCLFVVRWLSFDVFVRVVCVVLCVVCCLLLFVVVCVCCWLLCMVVVWRLIVVCCGVLCVCCLLFVVR